MRGPLALLGSGEYTDALMQADEFLLSKVDKPHVALFATAAAPEPDWQKWNKMGVEHFKKLDIEADGISLLKRSHANSEELAAAINKYNIFYFSGGNPGYLLNVLKDSLVWKNILELHNAGAVLAGCSAGAMVFGKKVWARIFDFYAEKKVVAWETGLNLVDFGVVAHYDAMPKHYTADEIKIIEENYPADIPLMGIDEDTAYINYENGWQLIGNGQVHKIR